MTAVHPDFVTVSIDINKAFLQGLTYDELAAMTGEPRRHVAFTFLKGAAAQLRKTLGYEDFNEYLEWLECTNPGTGCKRTESIQFLICKGNAVRKASDASRGHGH